MNEAWSLVAALGAGVAIGGMFFSGLWWTIRTGLSTAQPALWFLGSLLLRTALAVTGFWLVLKVVARNGGDDALWTLLACSSGFLVARLLSTRMLGRAREKRRPPNGKSLA